MLASQPGPSQRGEFSSNFGGISIDPTLSSQSLTSGSSERGDGGGRGVVDGIVKGVVSIGPTQSTFPLLLPQETQPPVKTNTTKPTQTTSTQVPPPPPITPPFPQSTRPPAPPHALYVTPLQGVVMTEGLLRELLQVEGRIHDLQHGQAEAAAQILWLHTAFLTTKETLVKEMEAVKERCIAEMREASAQLKGDEAYCGDDEGDREMLLKDEEEDVMVPVRSGKKRLSGEQKNSMELVKETFKLFLGVTKLDKATLPEINTTDPHFPDNLPPISTNSTGTIKQEHFEWKNTPSTPHNNKALTRIAQHVKIHHEQIVGGMGEIMAKLSVSQIKEKMARKLDGWRAKWRGKSSQRVTAPGGEQGPQMFSNHMKSKGDRFKKAGFAQALYPAFQSDDEDYYKIKKVGEGKDNSEGETGGTERKKKTTNNNNNDSSSSDKDSELEGSESGMAKGEDDDDDDDEGDGEGEGNNKKPNRERKSPPNFTFSFLESFRTWPAAWESQLLWEFKDYLDKQPDTCKGANQAYKRVCRKKKEKEIPRVFTFEGRCRRWMIDPVWWEKRGKSKYDEPLQVAANGCLWGEEDDPEEEVERVKALEVEKKAVKQQREEEAKVLNANKKVKRG
ncbi:hypothetical protein FA13DRAFT_1804312 [Coprinellus micaceus]|uniref:Uncharacterized protein n=1 Tax=Coprinellus micaceus TaxID=71717 RepID=A0A4Y7S8R5_COPMI|nr:hypothetical protein FA13DRAFT_1804312 [Coprinellus micaceus]